MVFQSKNKKGGKKISLTPSFFGGRRGRNPSQSENGTETDNHQSDVSGIIGVKDYIPNADKNKSTKNGRPRPENVRLFSIELLVFKTNILGRDRTNGKAVCWETPFVSYRGRTYGIFHSIWRCH